MLNGKGTQSVDYHIAKNGIRYGAEFTGLIRCSPFKTLRRQVSYALAIDRSETQKGNRKPIGTYPTLSEMRETAPLEIKRKYEAYLASMKK